MESIKLDEIKDNNDLVNRVKNFCENKTEWVDRYATYVKDIKANEERITEAKKHFDIRSPFILYTSVSKETSYSTIYWNLRVNGQIVAEIKRCKSSDEIIYQTNESIDKNNTKYFSIDGNNPPSLKGGFKKDSKEATEFRSYFERNYGGYKDRKLKSEEHKCETKLLNLLKSSDIKNIQPVKLNNCYFQFPTPFNASSETISYSSSSGGGIDILARTGSKKTDLIVFELKDEYKEDEPPSKAIKQALTYATFLAELLCNEKTGKGWWQIIRESDKEEKSLPKNIYVVTLMPFPKEINKENINETILFEKGNNKINLKCRSCYFDKDDLFNNELKQIEGLDNIL